MLWAKPLPPRDGAQQVGTTSDASGASMETSPATASASAAVAFSGLSVTSASACRDGAPWRLLWRFDEAAVSRASNGGGADERGTKRSKARQAQAFPPKHSG